MGKNNNVIANYRNLTLSFDQSVSFTPTPDQQLPTTTPASTSPIANCNLVCQTNEQCGDDLLCYQNRCRHKANLTSEFCASPADAGLSKGCNQYCANDGECASGLACWYNKCRKMTILKIKIV